MRKFTLTIGMVLMGFIITFNVQAQKMDKFGSSTEKKVGPKTIRVPYTDVVTYLGYAEQGAEDETKEDKKFYYIYVWIPAVAPELGIRMASPVPDKYKMKKPLMAANYEEKKDSEEFFDTYITLESSDIFTADKISEENVKNAKWVILERNDDSSEMPENPSGSSYNSLLRYKSEVGNPEKALTAGLYRVGFTTYKVGEVQGTFLAEVAAPVKLPGVAVAKTLDELLAQIND